MMHIAKSKPKLSGRKPPKKLPVLSGSEASTVKKIPERPPIDLVVDFITQAEDLAHGKRQVEVVAAVASQFAELVDHADGLAIKVANLRKAHSDLLDTLMNRSI